MQLLRITIARDDRVQAGRPAIDKQLRVKPFDVPVGHDHGRTRPCTYKVLEYASHTRTPGRVGEQLPVTNHRRRHPVTERPERSLYMPRQTREQRAPT